MTHPRSAELPATLPGYLARWAAERGRAIALRHKLHGRWVAWTWADLQVEVVRVAAALAARGFGPGDVVAIATGASSQGLVVTLAAQGLGGAAIWVDGPEAAVVPAARFGLAADETSLAELQARFGFLGPWVLGLVTAAHATPHDRPGAPVRAYADVAAARDSESTPSAWRARPTDAAFFWVGAAALGSRASAAGAAPRLTHASLVGTARAWLAAAGVGEGDCAFTWESPATEAAAMFVAAWLVGGLSMELPEDGTTADADRRELQPTVVAATAAAYDHLGRQVADGLPVPGTVLRAIVNAGLAPSAGGWVRRALGEWLVRRPLRRVLGLRRARAAVVLGAAAPPAAAELLTQLGLPLLTLPAT